MALFGTRKKRLAAFVAVIALVAVGGGAAVAYWTGNGIGVGTASTGTSTNFTISSDPSANAPLIPGGAAQTVDFTVTNAAAGSQKLTSVVVRVANADGTTWVATVGCSSADYTIGTPAIVYGQLAGGADLDGTVTIAMNNLATNQDACQGVTAPLYFAAS